jgi:hypothetical protein
MVVGGLQSDGELLWLTCFASTFPQNADTIVAFKQNDSRYPDHPGVFHAGMTPCDVDGKQLHNHHLLPERNSVEFRMVFCFDLPEKIRRQPLPADWISYVAASGQRWYWNERTKKSQWEHPGYVSKQPHTPCPSLPTSHHPPLHPGAPGHYSYVFNFNADGDPVGPFERFHGLQYTAKEQELIRSEEEYRRLHPPPLNPLLHAHLRVPTKTGHPYYVL